MHYEQEYVHGARFEAGVLLKTVSAAPNDLGLAAGRELGRVFVADLALRNSDRLIDSDLKWRGNLSNMIISAPVIFGETEPCCAVWAIDTTLCRRPPRLAQRADATSIPRTISRSLDPEQAPHKLKELIGIIEIPSTCVDGFQLLVSGFVEGVRSSLAAASTDFYELASSIYINNNKDFVFTSSFNLGGFTAKKSS